VHYVSAILRIFLVNSTNTTTITSPPPVASKFSFNNATALTISMKSKHLCKKRLSVMISDIYEGCLHHEHEDIELEKIGNFLFSFVSLSFARGSIVFFTWDFRS
jgi:hypothetical protein